VFILHYGGHPARMKEIHDASQGLLLLEDAANGPASTYMGRAVGTLADAGVWSFDAMKILSMGDGGMLWARLDAWHDRAEALRYMGLAQPSGIDSSKKKDRWWEFELETTSGRHTSNDLLACAARVQLMKMPGFIKKRQRVWERYQAAFEDVPEIATPPEPMEGCTTSYYLYWIQCERRDELARHLHDNGVYATFRYWPLHMVKYYGAGTRLEAAEHAADVTLCLPLHQNLEDADVTKVIELTRGFFGR
jgi:aminotransferase